MKTRGTPNKLVTTLMDRQRAEGWSNQRMADEIGTSRENWRFLKAGRHQPSLTTVKQIVGRFPEYTNLALFFLLPQVTNSNLMVTENDQEVVRVA